MSLTVSPVIGTNLVTSTDGSGHVENATTLTVASEVTYTEVLRTITLAQGEFVTSVTIFSDGNFITTRTTSLLGIFGTVTSTELSPLTPTGSSTPSSDRPPTSVISIATSITSVPSSSSATMAFNPADSSRSIGLGLGLGLGMPLLFCVLVVFFLLFLLGNPSSATCSSDYQVSEQPTSRRTRLFNILKTGWNQNVSGLRAPLYASVRQFAERTFRKGEKTVNEEQRVDVEEAEKEEELPPLGTELHRAGEE